MFSRSDFSFHTIDDEVALNYFTLNFFNFFKIKGGFFKKNKETYQK